MMKQKEQKKKKKCCATFSIRSLRRKYHRMHLIKLKKERGNIKIKCNILDALPRVLITSIISVQLNNACCYIQVSPTFSGRFLSEKTQWAKINSRNIDLFVAKIFFFPEKVSRENLIPLRYALLRWYLVESKVFMKVKFLQNIGKLYLNSNSRFQGN